MNAYELADELKEISLIADNHTKIVLGIAETMLRQQQAEIEALKARLNPYKAITDTKIEPTVVSYTHPVKELTDDGDAFRLAVKLKIEVYHGNDEGNAVYAGYYTPENTSMKYCIEYYDDITHMGDACSATRRAIVRAATEIGKTNPLRKASEK